MIEKFWDFMDSCSLFLLLSTFFGGYDLYIIALISPSEPERAAEARRAVVASIPEIYEHELRSKASQSVMKAKKTRNTYMLFGQQLCSY